jgi:hypothetical protein
MVNNPDPNNHGEGIDELEESMIKKAKRPNRRARPQAQPVHSVESMKTMRKVLLAALISLGAIPTAYLAEKVSGYSPSVGSLSLEIQKQSSGERYIIPQQTLSKEAKEELDRLKKSGFALETPDKWTGNTLDKYSAAESMDEEVIIRNIQGHEVKGKKSEVDYYEAAWKVLAELGYPFHGNAGKASDFRTNEEQFGICPQVSRDCGPITGGSHATGQANDVLFYFTKKTINPGGEEVGAVLEIFGFYWMKDTKWGLFKKGTLSFVMGGKDVTEAYGDMDKTDFVHFQMSKSSLEKMEMNGGIKAATQKAKNYLEGRKKEKGE